MGAERRREQWRALLLPIYLPGLLLAFCHGILMPVLPLYVRFLEKESYVMVGLALAAAGCGTLLADIPAGLLAGKLGRKRAMVIGLACMIGSVLALAWTNDLRQLILCRLLTGMGSALWNVARHAYIADAIPIRRRGRALALFGGVGRIGALAGPAVGGVVALTMGFRAAFVLFALLATGALTAVVMFVDGRRYDPDGGDRPGRAPAKKLFAVVRTHYPELIAAGSGQILAQTVRAARRVIIPLYAADVIGLGVGSVGLILSISWAADTSMFYPAGLIMDRWGRKRAIVPCFLVQGIGMALVPLTGGFLGLTLAACLIGLGNGLGSGSMMTLGADLAPREARTQFLGIWRLLGDMGQVGGPLGVGALADVIALSGATLVVASVGVLAASVFGFFVRETLPAPTPTDPRRP